MNYCKDEHYNGKITKEQFYPNVNQRKRFKYIKGFYVSLKWRQDFLIFNIILAHSQETFHLNKHMKAKRTFPMSTSDYVKIFSLKH